MCFQLCNMCTVCAADSCDGDVTSKWRPLITFNINKITSVGLYTRKGVGTHVVLHHSKKCTPANIDINTALSRLTSNFKSSYSVTLRQGGVNETLLSCHFCRNN